MNNNRNDNVASSLFTGEHSVFVQNMEQQDDEEDLEDQMRRQEELQNLIANAFDDFEYEDENSRVNSSFESTVTSKNKSNNSNVLRSVENYSFTEENYKNTSLNSFEQLQILYQVRVQETQKLAKDLEELKKQLKDEKEQASRKLLLLEADNSRINISLKQSQELLVEKNEDINTKSKEINQLKEFIENLQTSNEKFEEEVLLWKANYNELEQKLHLMEKGVNKNISKKQIRSHYEDEINKLQEVIENSNKKLEKLEQDCQILQNKIQEVEFDKEKALSEKASVINSITKNLEESQSQCFSLLSKMNALQQEKSVLEQEITSRQDKTFKNTTNQNYEDVIITLREELKRCLEERSKKRKEIKQLEDYVKEYREKEKILEEELNKQSKELLENDKLKSENKNLKTEILNLQLKIREFEEQNYKELNESANSLKSTSSEKNQKQMEEYKKLEHELKNVEKQIHETLNLKDRYINCEQQCLKLQETIADLNSKLSESQLTITTLKEKLVLKEERDDLIEEMKKKAAMFEEYMANKQNPIVTINTSINTSLIEKYESSTQTEDDQQILIFIKQLNDLDKIVKYQTEQLQVLHEENKSLKEKILFDRNAFTELTSIWAQETKKLNNSLHLTVRKQEELLQEINNLKQENAQKQLLCELLYSKMDKAKEYIKLIEDTNTRQNKHILFEYGQIAAKFENLLGMIQARLTRCIDETKTNVSID